MLRTPFKDEVLEIIAIADSADSELMFQNDPTYKKFKNSKKSGHKAKIQCLMSHLESLKFYQEAVFWANRSLNERGCDKNERCEVFITLSLGYHGLMDYQKTMEFGQKFLDLKTDKSLADQSRILSSMVDASKHLQDDEKTNKLMNKFIYFVHNDRTRHHHFNRNRDLTIMPPC